MTYLGIVLDQYLDFKPHIENVTKQIVRATGILWKVRKFLPAESLTTLYYALIQSHLLHGLAIRVPHFLVMHKRSYKYCKITL